MFAEQEQQCFIELYITALLFLLIYLLYTAIIVDVITTIVSFYVDTSV
jgi:hypothetical protein